MPDGSGNKSGHFGGLHDGLKDKAPKFPDQSMKVPSGSVNDDATRSGAAKSPSAPGGRCA